MTLMVISSYSITLVPEGLLVVATAGGNVGMEFDESLVDG